MDNRSDDLLHEVSEQLQWERFEKFVKQYGATDIALVLSVILGVAGYVYWGYYQETKNQALSEKFTQSLALISKDQKTEAMESLQELSKDSSTYGMLSRFILASIQLDSPDTRAKAVDIYKEMIENRDVNRRYRSLAILFLTMAELDTGDPIELAQLLEQASTGTNLWPDTTAELSAVVAIKKGDLEQAKIILKNLQDEPNAPQGVRLRAMALLQSLQQK